MILSLVSARQFSTIGLNLIDKNTNGKYLEFPLKTLSTVNLYHVLTQERGVQGNKDILEI